jgi:rod shape determining protein RodA
MLEYAGSQRRGLRADRGEGVALLGVVRSLDWILLAGVAGLVAIGLWGIAGVTKFDVPGEPRYYLDKQILYAAVGGALLLAATFVDPDVYRRYWRIVFGGTVGLIAVVFVVGRAARGSTRWIHVGFFTFQPSEFGKLLFVLALAGLLAERQRVVGAAGTTLRVLALGLVPVVLVFAQPDLGTALVYLAALGAMLFVAGSPWRHLTLLGSAAAAVVVVVLWAGPAVGVDFLKSCQKERLICFTHPSTCPADARYNVEQSIAAVGSGQVRGRGPNGSTQTRLDFLPEHHTDFVFASFSEQRGFMGASFLLALYLLVLWRGLRVVAVARDLYSAVVAGGIVVALLFQIFVNVGMTMGIAPITGIPLPFVSVGGSSMIANLAAMGVLLAIHARSRGSRTTRVSSRRR